VLGRLPVIVPSIEADAAAIRGWRPVPVVRSPASAATVVEGGWGSAFIIPVSSDPSPVVPTAKVAATAVAVSSPVVPEVAAIPAAAVSSSSASSASASQPPIIGSSPDISHSSTGVPVAAISAAISAAVAAAAIEAAVAVAAAASRFLVLVVFPRVLCTRPLCERHPHLSSVDLLLVHLSQSILQEESRGRAMGSWTSHTTVDHGTRYARSFIYVTRRQNSVRRLRLSEVICQEGALRLRWNV